MKPWLRQSSASLPPEVDRVAHPVPPRAMQGARDDTSATSAECAAIHLPLPSSVLDGLRDDTGSSAEELLALSRRLRAAPSRRSVPLLAPALAFATALVIAVPAVYTLAQLEPAPTASVAVGLGEIALEAGTSYQLSPDIRVEGRGLLSVDRLHDAGADVAVVQGWGRFHVEPHGRARALRVAASNVVVQVQGTVFTVSNQADRVRVAVERGRVAIAHQHDTIVVGAGGSWERPAIVSAAVTAAGAAVVRSSREPAVDLDRGGQAGLADPSASPHEGVAEPDRPASEASAAVRAAAESPSSARPPRAIAPSGAADLAHEPGATRDPCAVDPFSRACAAERRPSPDGASEDQLFHALRLAMNRVGVDPAADRTTVEACNRFLEQHPAAPTADDVRAFRVHAALTGARPSQVVRWADAYLASADPAHAERGQVERWRALAVLRGDALDSAQTGACDDALPLLRELVQIEQGGRRDQAIAWRGVCAAAVGNRDEARRALRSVREPTLPADLRRRVADAWATIR